MGKHFLGDYKPVNVYRNNVKLAGWTATEKTGESISYTDTYNDKFNSLVADGAEPQSLADWHGVSGTLTQGGTPTPTAPVAITPNIAAGSYKIARPAGGWWTITLADDMRGISTYADKVNLDLLTGKGKLRKRISKKVFDGTTETSGRFNGRGDWGNNDGYATLAWYTYTNGTSTGLNWRMSYEYSGCMSEHFIYIGNAGYNGTSVGMVNSIGGKYIAIRIPHTVLPTWDISMSAADRTSLFMSWLAAEYTAGTPVTVYYVLATETVTDLTLTHTDTSDLPELTLADLGITVSSLDYPFTIYESNNNFISISNATEVKQTVSLPTLRAIGTVKDRYDILSGVKTHKVSEWINPADYTMTATPQTGYMQMFTPVISGTLANSAIHGYKFNGAKLGNGMTAADYGKVHTDGTICITAAPADTGWGVTPTAAEVKAYFLGWMMCNADGTAPYLSGTKNWKHITDGTGLTATLPTATYAGYTPYRLLYQLAAPAEEQLTGTSVPTYPWHTDIAQTGDIKDTITANAKVMA